MTLREETEQINAETERIRQQRLEMERELAEPMNLNEQLKASIAMEDEE